MSNQGGKRSVTATNPRVQPALLNVISGIPSRKKSTPRSKHSSLWRRSSSIIVQELRFEVYFHLPGRSELERVLVHRSQSLVCLQAALQRQFGIPFEQQKLFFNGEQLEGDDDLNDYGLQDKSVVVMRASPRYRRIGDVFSTIQTIHFTSPTSRLDDFQIVDVPAVLPPLRIVFQRIAHAITYLTTLDRMQAQRTHRRVWRQHVTFWDEAPVPSSSPRNHLIFTDSSRPHRSPIREQVVRPSNDRKSASYVLQTSNTDQVASILALAKVNGVQARLQRSPGNRSSADIRNLKKWLASLRYFADARLPDSTFHELARTSIYLRVNSGEFVFRQGEAGDCFYVLVTGCVSLAAYSTGFFRTLTPGSCFGEISLIEPMGLRTASACVTFATPWAELVVVSGDLYRRSIKPYKQVVLRGTEKAIASIPRMLALPPHILTHLAYATRSLTAREGRHIICRGEIISMLVLLVQGSVKVSKPSVQGKPIVAVVQAPAIFGQEGALATTISPAPWEVVALETCSLLCLRKDTIASFLSPLQEIVRTIMAEHYQRLQDFTHRFDLDSNNDSSRELVHEVRPLRSTSVISNNVLRDSSPRHARNKSLIFPQILVREESVKGTTVVSRLDELARPATSDGRDQRQRSPQQQTVPKRPATQQSTRSSPSCAELEAQYLSHVLPFSGIINLEEQLQYASFGQQQKQFVTRFPDEYTAEDSKTTALLNGLRRLTPEDVVLVPSPPRSDREIHYRFVPLKSPRHRPA